MKSPCLLLMVILCFVGATGNSQRLDFFTSQTGNSMITGSEDKVPYDETTGYFDFIPSGSLPDSIIEGSSFYYVYFKLPHEVTEIGVRMISPVPPYAFAEAGDEVTEVYESNIKSTNYFNPGIALENGISDEKESHTGKIKSWEPLGKNDDSQQLIAQPDGNHTNSLLRVYQGPYPAGIYRVKFNTGKKEDAFGSYLLQIGTIPGVKRMKMSRKLTGDL